MDGLLVVAVVDVPPGVPHDVHTQSSTVYVKNESSHHTYRQTISQSAQVGMYVCMMYLDMHVHASIQTFTIHLQRHHTLVQATGMQ